MAAAASADPAVIEDAILTTLNTAESIPDSRAFAASIAADHAGVENVLKSLSGFELIEFLDVTHERHVLTEEGKAYAAAGSPEVQLFNAVPPEGITRADLEGVLGAEMYKIGSAQAMKNKWLQMSKVGVTRKVEHVEDDIQYLLQKIGNGEVVDEKERAPLTKRKLILLETSKSYIIRKGPKYTPKRKKVVAVLTKAHLQRGDWKDLEFKQFNFNAQTQPIQIGYLHPVLQVREAIDNIFLFNGFEEMPTNNFVESSFWNFDALFQPQQHPARDSQDTFFLQAPSSTRQLPEDYLERVKRIHESGGYGSKGYGYNWKREEAEKNLLRTHTTAVSARMLYKLAQQCTKDGIFLPEVFKPKRYYSIDRVFRNEAVDKTHLAEFHQIEGLICDRGLTLGDLFGILKDFFASLGMTNLKFKPAYNPYTEPSMEIFCYHEGLKKMVEIGNSGMFRPEMLRPMGFPEDVTVIAWGLSLERPTMILYDIDNIRELFGPRVDFDKLKSRANQLCRLGLQSLSQGVSSLAI